MIGNMVSEKLGKICFLRVSEMWERRRIVWVVNREESRVYRVFFSCE